MLTSGKTQDPRPWRNRYDKTRWADNWADSDVLEFRPRKRYRTDTENPILRAMRGDLETVRLPDRWEDYAPEDRNLGGVAKRWDWYILHWAQDVSHDPEHMQHALDVIGRILAIYYPERLTGLTS